MKGIFTVATLLILFSYSSFGQDLVNVAAMANGTVLMQTPKSKVLVTDRVFMDKYSAGALFDESENVWSSRGTVFPFVFVIELSEEYNIQKLEFDNRCEFYPGIEAKNVSVEFSTEGSNEGFVSAGNFLLEREQINEFNITPQKTRWIKISILDNYGNKEYVQLAEFKAFGVPGNRIGETVDIHGVWHTNWQDMTFVQDGKTFTGKYVYMNDSRKYKGKVKDGVIYRNGITFEWNEGNASGTARLFMNQEGTKLSGLWRNAHHENDFNIWSMTRKKEESKAIEYTESIAPTIIQQEESPSLESKEIVATTPPVVSTPQATETSKPEVKIGDTKLEEIKKGEAIVMKNINFKQGAANVSPDSYDELNVLFEYLTNNENANIQVNGHTDKIGDPKKNIVLSQARANAIKKYLTNKGIDKKRIKAIGLGDSKTICPSPCPENRRVDFVLID